MEIDLEQMQKRLLSKSVQGSQEKWQPDSRHLEIMERFWNRMTQLYQHKWKNTAGVHLDENGYTETFQRWCKELGHFTDKDWKRAYNRIESDIKHAAKLGENIWPPSTLEVIAYAEPLPGMYKSFDRSTAIEDKTTKEKLREMGKEQCSKLLNMFD